jgi:hypothetical protein
MQDANREEGYTERSWVKLHHIANILLMLIKSSETQKVALWTYFYNLLDNPKR